MQLSTSNRKCPYCGSTSLVWDSERGLVICPECGSVISENTIEDLPKPRYKDKLFYKQKRQRKVYWLPRINTVPRTHKSSRKQRVFEKEFVRLIESRTRIYLKTHNLNLEETSRLLETTIPDLKTRKRHVKLALIVYIIEALEGSSKKNAIKTAHTITGVNIRTLAGLIQRYRNQLDRVEEWVVEHWRNKKKDRYRNT
ncbi:MAG: TFIIB-type zinc ribbon-containing protein [Desulfurococcales archaeon]|nr:TFIIB-type zinc ribbon-containing protein [Desulfurococcales archaeon]